MVVFHEIIGPILASVAVMLTLFLFKKTIDFQAYRELDSDYMAVLEVGLDHPELRDIDHINKYPAFMDINDRGKYDTFAMMVWNMLETMYDRHEIDKTWYPVFESKSKLHYKWLKKPENRKYFKNEFLEFIDICNNEVPPEVGRTTTEMQMRTKKEMRRRTTKRVVKIGAF
jgi:hypothetical protein